jgi:exopolyphosphatase/guanosine-5'-triphosphate,3'-diphosphate pyrophosphatase
MTEPLYAAVDCGTNSTRLLISDGRSQIERHMRVTRLGAGVDRTGRLDPEAIERTLAVMRDYRGIMDRYEVAGVRIAATSASRDASNRADFFGPATEILGAEPELISGGEEAQLSFNGATRDLPPIDGRTLVVDIGGGSTEFALGTDELESSLSVDMGCVRMTEKFLHHDPPLPEELSNALSVVEQHLDDVAREVPGAGEADRFVGLAGTVTTIAAVELGLADYSRDAIHHFVLTRGAAEDVFRTLATEAIEARRHNPGLDPGRVDVIVGGCCVLVGIFRYFGFDECVVSEADILDGLILSQMGS